MFLMLGKLWQPTMAKTFLQHSGEFIQVVHVITVLSAQVSYRTYTVALPDN